MLRYVMTSEMPCSKYAISGSFPRSFQEFNACVFMFMSKSFEATYISSYPSRAFEVDTHSTLPLLDSQHNFASNPTKSIQALIVD